MSVKCKLLVLLLVLVATPNLRSQDKSGTFDLRIPAGEHILQGILEVFQLEQEYFGRVKISLPNPINFSLHSERSTVSTLQFKASSPALMVWVEYAGDSIRGAITLNGGREFKMSGQRISATSSTATRDQFVFRSVVSSDSLGFAFPSLSPGGDMLVFSAYHRDFSEQQLMYIYQQNGNWSYPDLLPFSGEYNDRSPVFAKDGSLYFSSTRPVDGGIEREDYDIWWVRRAGDSWHEPQWVEGINSTGNDYQPSVTQGGIYFSSDREGGLGGKDIYFARGQNGLFQSPEILASPVNSEYGEMSANVSYDGTKMVLSTSNPAYSKGNDDLIFLTRTGGEWRVVEHPAKVNTFANEYGAFYSFDGKWLYYTSDIVPFARIYRIGSKLTRSSKN